MKNYKIQSIHQDITMHENGGMSMLITMITSGGEALECEMLDGSEISATFHDQKRELDYDSKRKIELDPAKKERLQTYLVQETLRQVAVLVQGIHDWEVNAEETNKVIAKMYELVRKYLPEDDYNYD